MPSPLFRPAPPLGGPNPDDDLTAKWRTYKSMPGPATSGPILKALQPSIESGIKAFGGASGNNANLRSRARILALDALDTYDPARGPLKGHVMGHMRGLTRYATKQQQTLSVPEAVMLDHKRLADASRELAEELGRDPSDAELADRTGVNLKRIGAVRGAQLGMAQGQVESMTTDEEGDPGDVAVVGEDPTARLAEFVYHDADDVDRVILEHRLGLRGKPVLSPGDLARKLNLSPARISQRSERLARQMEELRDAGL